MTTYGDLFDYLISQLGEDIMRGCDHTLRHTEQFAEMHGLSFESLSGILRETGGYCDCEVLFNSECRIPDEEVIGVETFTGPMRIAREKGFYCHCRVDGTPVSFPEAMAAREAGRKVEWWVPCGKDDPHAMPDSNRAIASLLELEE